VTAGIVGADGTREFLLERDDRGSWSRDGERFAEGDGCADADLGWTPATNTIPIRRLGLAPGESASIRVVWIRYPELDVVAADQHYECLSTDRFRFSSGDFSAVLEVDDDGIVLDYEGLWRRVPIGHARPQDT
jgi:hypothetical protein